LLEEPNMPIYEYQCAACEKTFEEWQKISEPPVKKCPGCGSKKVSRLISQTSFQLKGSGWYVTEYGKGGVKPDGPAMDSKTGAEVKAASSSTEDKAAAKTTAKDETPAAEKVEKTEKPKKAEGRAGKKKAASK